MYIVMRADWRSGWSCGGGDNHARGSEEGGVNLIGRGRRWGGLGRPLLSSEITEAVAVGVRTGNKEDMGPEAGEEDLSGCLKTRLDLRGRLGVLWEGRTKELLYSVGMNVELAPRGGNMWKGVGVEIAYSP